MKKTDILKKAIDGLVDIANNQPTEEEQCEVLGRICDALSDGAKGITHLLTPTGYDRIDKNGRLVSSVVLKRKASN